MQHILQRSPLNTTSAGDGISMSKFRNLNFKVKRWRRPLSFAGSNDTMPQALMIAPRKLYDAKVTLAYLFRTISYLRVVMHHPFMMYPSQSRMTRV